MRNGKQLSVSKYKNKKIVLDGFKFDSKLEAEYYLLLRARKQSGQIKDFKLQQRYVLQEAFTHNGKKYRKIEYIADFEILQKDGTIIVVDCKGVQTTDFKIKAKLFVKRYGTLKLVKKTKAGLETVDF